MAKRLPDILEEARDALLGRRKNHSWSGSAGEVYSATIAGIKDFSGDTLSKTADSFNAALPFIERAGYRVLEIEVGLGLSPKISAHLALDSVVTGDAREALIAETEHKKLIRTILAALFQAADARSALKFNRFHFALLELELSVLPTVTLKFRPDDESDMPALTGPDPIPLDG